MIGTYVSVSVALELLLLPLLLPLACLSLIGVSVTAGVHDVRAIPGQGHSPCLISTLTLYPPCSPEPGSTP